MARARRRRSRTRFASPASSSTTTSTIALPKPWPRRGSNRWRNPRRGKRVGRPMAKLGFLFPGQGAQAVGMGKELCAAFPLARRTYEEAADAAHVDFARLSFEGPEAELRKTQNAQPAILIHSIACHRLLTEA